MSAVIQQSSNQALVEVCDLLEGAMGIYTAIYPQDLNLPSALAHTKDRATGFVCSRTLDNRAYLMAQAATNAAYRIGRDKATAAPKELAKYTAAFCVAQAVLDCARDIPHIDNAHTNLHMAESFHQLAGDYHAE